MFTTLLLLLIVCLLYVCVSLYISFKRNLKLAKDSGIHYVTTPIFWVTRWWLVTQKLWFKLLVYLPASWTTWVDVTEGGFVYAYRHEIFLRLGHDTFLTVAPTAISLFTADAAVISQMTARRNDFPKPVEVYKALDIFGRNVVSAEGQYWKHHRKAVSPPFTEKNNHLVWSETVRFAKAMLDTWLGPDGTAGPAIDRVMDDTMRLSLYVISGAGFGRSLEWPSKGVVKVHSDARSKIQNTDEERDPGHSMSWTYALHALLDTIFFHIIFPRWFLKAVPTKITKKADLAYGEWARYMSEAVEKAKQQHREADDPKMDLLGQLVKSQMDVKGSSPLTDSEISGNMFVLMLAGHETAANSIHFSILYLALHPESQKRLQEELDTIFEGAPPSMWNYDKHLPALFGGMAGAVLAEELRLIPPVLNIPKSTLGVKAQTLMVEGKECTVPSDVYISLSTAAVARNPKYWPSRKPTLPGGHTAHPIANLDNDLEEFHPERWLVNNSVENKEAMQAEKVSESELGINESADTSDKLYRPVRGSYIPFSDGHRACIGRRFAQVEILAALAVLYQNHSIELSVDKYTTDAEVLNMDVDARAEVWQRAAEDARGLFLDGMNTRISLQMTAGTIPIRVVPRKQERFPANVDQIWKQNHPDKISSRGMPGWSSWKR